jgi:hypothetical protein
MDVQAYRHGSSLDAESMEPEYPKDAPADLCLDQLGLVRHEMGLHIERLMAGGAGMAAVVAYLQGLISQCVVAGIAEWMEQENSPSTFHGDEAVIGLLNVITGTMVGDGGQMSMTSRQVELHAWVIMFLLERTEKTLTQIADETGYTRANASAIAKKYQKKLELRKCRGMKSDQACEIYRKRATIAHRKRKNQTTSTTCTTTNKPLFNKFWTSTSER